MGRPGRALLVLGLGRYYMFVGWEEGGSWVVVESGGSHTLARMMEVGFREIAVTSVSAQFPLQRRDHRDKVLS
jgi:hypothetical protein